MKAVCFFSPGASKICIICQNNCDNSSGRTNLWTDDGTLTPAGKTLNDNLKPDMELSRTSNFQVLCRNCRRQLQTINKKKGELLEKVYNGKKSSINFVRKRFKRG